MTGWYINGSSSDGTIAKTTLRDSESLLEISVPISKLQTIDPSLINKNTAKAVVPADFPPETEASMLLHVKAGIEEILSKILRP